MADQARRTAGHGARPRRNLTLAPSAAAVAASRRGGPTMAERSAADPAADADRRMKQAVRAMWALGDYHAFATATVWGLGPVLVEACGVARGQRLLDVAAGTGNVAIRAAAAGASVVACDLT